MSVSKLPDWAVYGAIVAAILFVAQAGRERADAPPAPDLLQGSEGALIGLPAGFERTISVEPVIGMGAPAVGTAFAVSASGRWLTAKSLVKDCRRAAILVGAGQGLEAKVILPAAGEVAVLQTETAPTALPVAARGSVTPGERGFHVGYPQQRAGEFTSRLIGLHSLRLGGRGAPHEPVLAWAMVGRTTELHGPLGGMAGAPVLDAEGRVVGVTLMESRRRGRIYATTPEGLAALAAKGPKEAAPGQPITIDNYGRAADGLRRDLRVAQVRCL